MVYYLFMPYCVQFSNIFFRIFISVFFFFMFQFGFYISVTLALRNELKNIIFFSVLWKSLCRIGIIYFLKFVIGLMKTL